MEIIKFSLILSFLVLISCKNNHIMTKNSLKEQKTTIEKRFLLSCSDLHKQKSAKPTYLYEEISEQQAIEQKNERAYYIGYFHNGILIKYEKKYRGETLLTKEIQ
ncbi:hypothetical protein CAPN005_15210 [Capnocytophaga cynodegmi]|nr:hypothetical protein CAPN005_15210 [Capnocytophaga cynodegmi]